MLENPTHGEPGGRFISQRVGDHAALTMTGNQVWCGYCVAWVEPAGISAFILGTFCCPVCHKRWDDPPKPAAVEPAPAGHP